MTRNPIEVGLTFVLVVLALVACRRTCCPTMGGCCAPIAQASPVAPAPPAKPPKPPVLEPTAEEDTSWLEKRVHGLDWEELNLDQVLAYLSTITGKKFEISEEVRKESFEDTLITVRLDDVSLRNILTDVITAPYELRWEVRDGVVRIVTYSKDFRLRYYDVKDLVMKAQPATKPGFPQPAPVHATERVKQLESAIRRAFPGSWENDDATLEIRNGILIAREKPHVLKALDNFLSARRALSRGMRQKLEAIQINLSASNVTVADLLKTLQIQTGVNLMVDPRFEGAAENPVTGIKLESVSLWTALQILKSAAGEDAVWAQRGSVMVLTKTDFLPVGGK